MYIKALNVKIRLWYESKSVCVYSQVHNHYKLFGSEVSKLRKKNDCKMNEFEIPIGSLEELALKRKERLRNLKRKAATKECDSTSSSDGGKEKLTLPLPSKLVKDDTEEPVNEAESTEIELKNDDVISKISSEVESLKTPIVIDEIDIQNLAPRKPDWDLKRDVAKKLGILERRTQRAIAELIRERLRTNQGDVDLQAVNAVGYSAKPSSF